MTNSKEEHGKFSLLKFFLSVPLRFKITIPYLVAATLLAGLASYQVSRSYVSMLEGRFRGQLEDASFRVADGFFALEEQHLSNLRAINFTSGFPDAVAARDRTAMETLVYPQIVHSAMYFVDLLTSDGAFLASWHRQGDTLEYQRGEAAAYHDWDTVQLVASGTVDEKGDKYAEIVNAPWGLAIYTAGPVILDDETVGITLVGTPLEKIVPELASSSLSNVTLYDPSGRPVISTLGAPASLPPLGPEALERLDGDLEYAYTRDVTTGSREYVEAVDILYLREQPSGWYYGVALPKSLVHNTGVSTLIPLLLIFILGIILLFMLGVFVAQVIAIPIFRLLHASRQVGSGDLNAHVDVYANDEIGQLTQGFNHMVSELRQREFVREMFGRMVSRDVSEAVLRGEVAIGGEEREVAVLFTDVRDFTSLSEKHSPDEVISLLNQFFAIITEAMRKHHGVINHFGGDSILAVFGAPIERPVVESLRQAICTALEIRRGVVEVNAQRIANNQVPLRFGVGINSGTVIAGNVGTKDRFHYTVIGDVVNVAARLQGLSRQFPHTPLLVPGSSVRQLEDDNTFEFWHLGEFRLKGKEKPVSTYAVVGNLLHYPPDFTVFDGPPYVKTDALLACYLYCKGYSQPVIAKSLQVDNDVISRWLETASRNAAAVGEILVRHYQLSKSCYYRILGAAAEPGQTGTSASAGQEE